MTPSNISEKKIEDYLRKQVQLIGGKAYKFTSPNQRSVPDRLCVFPGGDIWFIEVKKPTGKLTPGQLQELSFLRTMGCKAITIWSIEDVNEFIKLRRVELNHAKGVAGRTL